MERFAGVRVLLGVTGGIGAYKAASVARGLVTAGAIVDVVLTRGAQAFIGAATFEGITGRPVRSEVWQDIAAETHVALGRQADIAIVYPATAHTLARLAHGLADDLLTTALLAFRGTLFVAPAMHTEMWEHAATQANVATLATRGVQVVGPESGPLMGGDTGAGRLVEPDALLDSVASTRTVADGSLRGKTIVVTAGGTREPLDPVRYLGNRSSGKMGFALAAAAQRHGARVVLVAAPTTLPTPLGVERVDVVTALEMREAVLACASDADVIIKAAAVADFRPARAASEKIKKGKGSSKLVLEPNPDILAELGAWRGKASSPLLVGFAAETNDVRKHAIKKIAAKRADLLVVNDVSRADIGFEVDTNEVAVLDANGEWTDIPPGTKDAVARAILDIVVERLDR